VNWDQEEYSTDRADKPWRPVDVLYHVEEGLSANRNTPGQFLAQEEAARETNISAENSTVLFNLQSFLNQGQQQQQQEYYQCHNVSSKKIQVQIISEGDAEHGTANSEYQHDTIDQEPSMGKKQAKQLACSSYSEPKVSTNLGHSR